MKKGSRRSMKTYMKPASAKDLREQGRIILAHGEATGHCHEIVAGLDAPVGDLPPAQFFEEPDGRRVLLAVAPCALRHDEHGLIPLNPKHPQQVRQGDVLLNPIGPGAWHVIRQREGYSPESIRQVAD